MQVAQLTDVGVKRQSNQDQIGTFMNNDQAQLLVLCDGMGGHNAGDVASEMALFHLGHAWEQTTALFNRERVVQWLETAIHSANERVHEKAQQYDDLNGMGTTLIAVMVLNGEAIIAHVGDSRVYRIRAEAMEQVTKDHSFVQELVDNEVITAEEAASHPQRNIVTRAIGTDETVAVETQFLPILADDLLLICSDGLSDMLSNETVVTILKSASTLDQAVEQLIAAANELGGKDNISVILAQMERSDLP